MRRGSQFSAWAASSTVALELSNSSMRSAIPQPAKYSLTFSIAILFHLLLSFRVWAVKLILALYSGFVNMFLFDKVRELCYNIIWKGVAL